MREPGLVRAELVDAYRDWAQLFREKAAMEMQRAAAIEAMADQFAKGLNATNSEVVEANQWALSMQLLEIRHNELLMRCKRLLIEDAQTPQSP